jgi:hypothetical protein
VASTADGGMMMQQGPPPTDLHLSPMDKQLIRNRSAIMAGAYTRSQFSST